MLHERRCIAVNNSYRIAPWSEVVWFGDVKWFWWHEEELLATNMQIATCNEHGAIRKHMGKLPQLTFYQRDHARPHGITTKQNYVSWNASSGASAINLAYHMGAKEIVLLGFDMRMVEGQKNWHNDHKEMLHKPFQRHLKPFPAIYHDAKELNLKIYNATPDSAITVFPMMEDLQGALLNGF